MKRRTEESEVSVTIKLPAELYFWVEFAATKKGLKVEEHISKWIIESLAPWAWDHETGSPLPLDVSEVHEYPEPEPKGKPEDTRPHREDFDSVEAYLEAKKRDRIARGQETRRRNREAQLKVIPDHIKKIAEARRQHPRLSLGQFSQFLFDAGIYRSGGWGRYPGRPVNSRTLSGWLCLARDAGLLR